ncbi:MAG: hypothetical protein ACQET8_22840 [Bacillota bacterium]
MKPYKIKIIAILKKMKSYCDDVIENYDGDCDDDHQTYKYNCEKAKYIEGLIRKIEQEDY